MKKRLRALILCVLLVSCLNSFAFAQNGDVSVVDEGDLRITLVERANVMFDVTVGAVAPAVIEADSITDVLPSQYIKTLTFTENITGISDSAFYDFENLTSVVIPATVTHVGANAFVKCDSLTSVSLNCGISSLTQGDSTELHNNGTFSGSPDGLTVNVGCTPLGDEFDPLVYGGNVSFISSHNPVFHAAKAATCTDDGNIAYYYCAACGKYSTDKAGTNVTSYGNVIIPATGSHSLAFVPAVQATCFAPGVIEHWECALCHTCFADENCTQVLTEVSILATNDHVYDRNGNCQNTGCAASIETVSAVRTHLPGQEEGYAAPIQAISDAEDGDIIELIADWQVSSGTVLSKASAYSLNADGHEVKGSVITISAGTVTVTAGRWPCGFNIIGGSLRITGGLFVGDMSEYIPSPYVSIPLESVSQELENLPEGLTEYERTEAMAKGLRYIVSVPADTEEKVPVYLNSASTAGASSIATVSGGGLYNSGDTATITAPYTDGYEFVGWYENGYSSGKAPYSASAVCTAVLSDSARYFTAVYRPTSGSLTLGVYASRPFTVTVNGMPANAKAAQPSGSFNIAGGQYEYSYYLSLTKLQAGSDITVSYSNEGGDFSAWMNKAGMPLTRSSPTYSFVLRRSTDCLLQTTASSSGSVYVEFVSDSGQLLKSWLWQSASAVAEATPVAPTRYGSTFAYWTYTDAQGTERQFNSEQVLADISSAGRLTLHPSYVSSEISYQIDVYINRMKDTNLSRQYSKGEAVILEAPLTVIENGTTKYFQNWQLVLDQLGTDMGSNPKYVILAKENCEVHAIYAETEPEQKAYIWVSDISALDEGGVHKTFFSVTRSLPETSTVIEQGIMYSISVYFSDFRSRESIEEEFVTERNDENQEVRKAAATSTRNSGVSNLSLNVTGGEEHDVFYRGYVYYTDPAGNVCELYTPVYRIVYEEITDGSTVASYRWPES